MSGLGLDGLASGFPTSEIIEQMVEIEKKTIDNLSEEKLDLKAGQDAWRDVNSRFKKLDDKLGLLKLSSTFNSNSAISSNEEVATATTDNSADSGSYHLEVKSTAQAQRVAGDRLDSIDTAFKDEFSTFPELSNITINEENIEIREDDNLKTLRDKINNNNTQVNASIVDNHLILESVETGVDNQIEIVDNNGVMEKLGLITTDIDGNQSFTNELQQATDAVIDLNGIKDITRPTNSFNDIVDGVTFNLEDGAQVDDTVTIDIAQDKEKATSAVQGFVDQYNSVMNFIDSNLDYDSETEKAGTLQGDSTLMRLQMRLRSLVTDRVDNNSKYNQLATVGVTVDRDGVMSFDSAKMTEALEEAPDEVMNLFKGKEKDQGFDGVGSRMDTYINQLIQSNTGVIPRRVDFFDKRMDNIDDDIESQERSLESTREKYIEQFAAMEKALSEMQEQGNWMMSQLQGMGGSSNLMSSMM